MGWSLAGKSLGKFTLRPFETVKLLMVKQHQYLSDIIEDLYWKKETYSDTYCRKQVAQ